MTDPAPARPDLAELRQRLAKAPDLPWNFQDDAEFPSTTAWAIQSANGRTEDVRGGWVAQDMSLTTARMIVAAVNALPLLLDWIEALQFGLREALELSDFHDGYNAADCESCRKYNELAALLSPSGSPEPPKP